MTCGLKWENIVTKRRRSIMFSQSWYDPLNRVRFFEFLVINRVSVFYSIFSKFPELFVIFRVLSFIKLISNTLIVNAASRNTCHKQGHPCRIPAEHPYPNPAGVPPLPQASGPTILSTHALEACCRW